jgi:hypothetical protein
MKSDKNQGKERGEEDQTEFIRRLKEIAGLDWIWG